MSTRFRTAMAAWPAWRSRWRPSAMFFLLACSTAFAAPHETAAEKLIRAAHLDRMAVHILPHFYFFGGASGDRVLTEFAQCISTKDSTRVAGILANAATTSLTKGEMQAVLGFYESAPGRKYAGEALRQLQVELGYLAPQSSPGFSEDERKSISAFLKSPGARKTSIDELFSVDRTAKRLFDEGLLLMEKCRTQSSP